MYVNKWSGQMTKTECKFIREIKTVSVSLAVWVQDRFNDG